MMTIEMIQMIISLASGIFALMGILVVIAKWLKNGNTKKVLALIAVVPELVKEAEKMFGKGHGADKFHWVMTMLKNQALMTKTKVSDEVLENTINDIVDTTNNVNVDKFPFANEQVATTPTIANVSTNIESNSVVSENF